jgi:hypothetical protein
MRVYGRVIEMELICIINVEELLFQNCEFHLSIHIR